MHWPKVCPRTATPPGTKLVCGMIATSVIPGIASTCAEVAHRERRAVDRRRPAQHRRQRARDLEVHRELLAPGDDLERVDPALRGADQRELRLRLELGRDRDRLRHRGRGWRARRSLVALPPGATIRPFWTVTSLGAGRPIGRRPSGSAGPCATAAATRTGLKIECIEFEPPVNWLQTSSGRASASVTLTLSSDRSISSAIVIATAVVIPCPTSARGSANETVPSVLTVTVIRPAVGSAASVRRSVRSYASTGWSVGIDGLGGLRRTAGRPADHGRGRDQVADEPPPRDAVGGSGRRVITACTRPGRARGAGRSLSHAGPGSSRSGSVPAHGGSYSST